MYDYVIYLGRFQPFHDGHYHTLKEACAQGSRVIVGVGSANRSRSTENPFTYQERYNMICESVTEEELEKLEIIPVSDYPYNDTAWLLHVMTSVNEYIRTCGDEPNLCNIAIIGFKKDATSRYLDWFPEWDYIGVEEQHAMMSATDIRNHFFQRGPIISDFVPDPIRKILKAFVTHKSFSWLLNEYEYLKAYPKIWGPGPFFTVDAVVEQMGYILLVTRKEPPFKGKLAMPGGFLMHNEWIKEAQVRELKEETRIADLYNGKWTEMPPAKIQSFLQKEKIYDDPRRSARGRVITFAGLYKLPASKELYHVSGHDDAEKASWYNLTDLDASMFMEDHYFIIHDMLGLTDGI